jgi:lipopolysaccharide/colanic/teichoic acid biosynthesis glycosyltransferase
VSREIIIPHSYCFSKTKRALDIFLVILFLPLFILTLPLIAFLIKTTSKGPIFFVQERVGKDNKAFKIYKFRTMSEGSDKKQSRYSHLNVSPPPTFKIISDPRFTRIGKILAKIGIDETPQIINIFKGEMSFVGPRPFPQRETKKIPQGWKFRYKVKPGILSSWGNSDRKKMTQQKWIALDKQDIKIASLKKDIKIILHAIVYSVQRFIHIDIKTWFKNQV